MSFWYLASPYSRYPAGIEAAFRVACMSAAYLIRAGVPVFSPIAHSHPIATHGGLDPYDIDLWIPADKPMMAAAKGLIVLKATGWDASVGVGIEITEFKRALKPVVYMMPGIVPASEMAHYA